MESWNPDYYVQNSTACAEQLKEYGNWEKIPLINTTPNHFLKEGSLAQFCGMVQDMYNPVHYLATYEVLNTVSGERSIKSGKYKDTLECASHERLLLDSESSVNEERRPVYCISVPALSTWAQLRKIIPKEVNHSSLQSCGSGMKRSAYPEEDQPPAEQSKMVVGKSDLPKKFCSSNAAMETEESISVCGLNLPIPNDEAEACLVNLYDVEDGQLQLNDVIEVVGFLSYDAGSLPEQELPPPSLVPRLHAVAIRPAPLCNPLITPQTTISDVMRDAPRLRGELKLVLTQLLLGDDLAADYLLCHLLSYIYHRQEVVVLGKLSLNLSHLPRSLPDYSTKLYEFLQTLVTKSHFFPMTLDNMNNTTMIPRKNYESDRLESGMLQLSARTHLVLDETQLQAGQLNDKGVKNCHALSSVITNQKLEYDFQFYPVEFNTDIPVLILSDGKSMLPSDCHVLLKPDPSCLSTVNEVFIAATQYLKEPILSQLRVYLSLVPTASYDLSEEVQKVVQDDFVKMRQVNSRTSAQDLHTLLVLAKILALSKGCQSLTKECWESACKMEQKRKERCNLKP